MILVGNQRGGATNLAHHLMKDENDRVQVHQIRGFVSDDLHSAFRESFAMSRATKCKQYLFSLSLNPPLNADLSPKDFEETVDRAEKQLGLEGQPRAIVLHTKNGRTHAHAVWSRIKTDDMRAVQMSFSKRKMQQLSRELYREHGWQMPRGFVRHEERDPRNFTLAEWQQCKRAKRDPGRMKEVFQDAWAISDSRAAFANALKSHGLILAKGDRRGHIAVDHDGEAYAISRYAGVKAKQVRDRLGDPSELPSKDEAQKIASDRVAARLAELQIEQTRLVQKNLDRLALQRQEQIKQQSLQEITLRRQQSERCRLAFVRQQARIRKGLGGLIDRVTGKRKEQEARNYAERQRLEQKDSSEKVDWRARADRAHHDFEGKENDLRKRAAYVQAELSKDAASLENRDQDPVSQEHEAVNTGLRSDPRQQLVLGDDALPFTKKQLLNKPDLILNHISQKEARFDRADILRALAKQIDDPVALQTAANSALKSPTLVQCPKDGVTTTYTTRDFQAAENSLAHATQVMAANKGFSVARGNINRAIHRQNAQMRRAFGVQLSAEQGKALDHVLGDRQLSCVVGLAGAGKSTLLATAKDAWARQGIAVHGAALAGKAADGLETASGISSRTLASFETSWTNNYEPIAKGDVLVVDEAGMIGTRQLARVARKIEQIGAKLVLVGDPDQLQPIEAGAPFRRIVDSHDAARLTEIHRQKDDWQKQASRDLADGRIDRAVEHYSQHNAVTRNVGRDAAIQALVERYTQDVATGGDVPSRLAFAHKRKDVHALNQSIRTALRSLDNPQPETLFATQTGQRAFAKEDRIAFTRNDKTIGVKNGMLGTVHSAFDTEITVKLDGDSRRTARFNPQQFQNFDHGYAVTIHKSQGATVDQAYVLASRSMDRHLAYVAMTRHRSEMRLFINEWDRPDWARQTKNKDREVYVRKELPKGIEPLSGNFEQQTRDKRDAFKAKRRSDDERRNRDRGGPYRSP